MSSSSFKKDLANEKIIKKLILDYLYNSELFEVDESDDREDILGSDLKLQSWEVFGDGDYHHIDVKSATNYRKIKGENSLPTFAFELQFTNQNREIKDGWLFGEQYRLTEYYLLSWIWVYDEHLTYPGVTLVETDVSSIEVIIVKKATIHNYLKNKCGVSKNNYKKLIRNFNVHLLEKQRCESDKYAFNLKYGDDGVLNSAELSCIKPEEYNNEKYKSVYLPKLFFSNSLNEKPYNIIIEKNKLLDLAIFHDWINFNKL